MQNHKTITINNILPCLSGTVINHHELKPDYNVKTNTTPYQIKIAPKSRTFERAVHLIL